MIQMTEEEHAELLKRVGAAEKFKTFVHAYLDQHGMPHGDPENQHQKEGCRIGARLDLIFTERRKLRAAVMAWTRWEAIEYPGDEGKQRIEQDARRLRARAMAYELFPDGPPSNFQEPV